MSASKSSKPLKISKSKQTIKPSWPTLLDTLKKRAKSIRARAAELHVTLSTTHALELLAASEHDKHWNAMYARYMASELLRTPLQPVLPQPHYLLVAPAGWGKSTVVRTLQLAYQQQGLSTLMLTGEPTYAKGFAQHINEAEVHDITSWAVLSSEAIRLQCNELCRSMKAQKAPLVVLYHKHSSPMTVTCIEAIIQALCVDKLYPWDRIIVDETLAVPVTTLAPLFAPYTMVFAAQYINALDLAVLSSASPSRPWHCIELAMTQSSLPTHTMVHTLFTDISAQPWSLTWSHLELSMMGYTFQSIRHFNKRHPAFKTYLRHDPMLLEMYTRMLR